MKETQILDVLIIGGSYAGLSAAMSLGRSLRNVVIIDSGMPCNWQTPHSHNFITQDGEAPAAIAAKAREQVLRYQTVRLVADSVITGIKVVGGFELHTESGKLFRAKKLLFATGIKDQLPKIKGLDACWGISVIHCPYCHGYEFRGKRTAILANGERAFHVASLVNNLTDRITLLTNGASAFSPEQLERLQAHEITVIETVVAEVDHLDGHLKHVIFQDGNRMSFDAMYTSVPFSQQCDVPATLGCELTEQGYLKIDAFFKTSVAGLYACGDNVSMMRSVANAVYSGNFAGAMLNKELTDESF